MIELDEEKIYNEILDISLRAAEIARKYSTDPSVLISEGVNVVGDVSRKIDLLLEDFIIKRIREFDHEALILTEEKGVLRLSDKPRRVYIVDPLDGSSNYATDTPYCSISIAVLRYSLEENDFIAGIVSEIFRDKVYGFVNRVAYVNNKKAYPKESSEHIIITYLEDPRAIKALYEIWLSLGKPKIRSLGSAALDIVKTSLGEFKGFVDLRPRLRNVDIAAAIGFAKILNTRVSNHLGEEIRIDVNNISSVKSLVVTRSDETHRKIVSIAAKYLSAE